MPELTPDELSALEDALEGLTGGSRPDAGSPPVQARLQEYDQVLTLCRASLPTESVPPEVLDGVLRQARAELDTSTPPPREPTATESEPRQPRWWYPTFALAGVGLLLALLIWGPRPSEKPRSEALATAERGAVPPLRAPGDAAGATQPATSAPPEPTRGREPSEAEAADVAKLESVELAVMDHAGLGEKPAGRQGAPDGTIASESAASATSGRAAQPARPRRSFKEKKLKSSRPAAVDGGAAVAGSALKRRSKDAVAAAAPPESSLTAKNLLVRAHRLRREGRCAEARRTYRRALARAQSPRHRGLAEAGIGLCLEQAGEPEAKQHLGAALDHDPTLSTWIAAERRRAP
ncbi:MAG: tetratricopeptide repeat protein [Myxococcales bacterium FL481]|nr:MAG: tetratricopeptide repeat protein [Myxococcales bacterium FL481]